MASKSPEVAINPAVLKWARNNLHLSIEEAAESIGVDVNDLVEWEAGRAFPSFVQLRKIGGVYKRATAVFLLREVPKEAAPPKDYRVVDDRDAASLRPATFIEIRKAQKKREYALELFKLGGDLPPEFRWTAKLTEDPETLGRTWRRRFGASDQHVWKDEYDALNFWKKAIEALGVLVFQASLESVEELRGMAVFHKRLPLILLNTKDSPRGRIFSLLHEFCHLLLQRSGIGNMEPSYKKKDNYNSVEVFCNAFAAACLLPVDVLLANPKIVLKDLKSQIENNLLDKLVRKYQVSWEVILRRFLDTGHISLAYYSSTRADLKEKYGKKSTGRFADYITKMISYNSEPYISLVLERFSAGQISVSEASDFLGVKADHFPKLQNQIQKRQRA